MKILVAIEDQLFGQAVIDYVIETAPEAAEIVVLNVLAWLPDAKELGACPALSDYVNAQTERSQSLTAEFAQRLRVALPSAKVATRSEAGHPARAIISIAAQEQADEIVVGSHARKGIKLMFLGSVSNAVYEHAGCPVTVIRLPRESAIQHDERLIPAGIVF